MTATPKMRGRPPTEKKVDVKNPRLIAFMEEECKPVKGIFKNFECPGGSAHIVQAKYPNQPVLNQILQDGQEYEIPLWAARYLNGIDVTAEELGGKIGSCSYAKFNYEIPEGGGTPVPLIGARRQRYGFQSLDFFKG